MEIDRPDVVAEVAGVFAGYEDALVRDDREAVLGHFWDSAATVRFGIADRQSGAAEIAAWRAGQPPVPPGRRLTETRIAVFGPDHAVVTTLFGYPSGAGAVGRQSQTWVRFPVGWRIVSAHVSEIAAAPLASPAPLASLDPLNASLSGSGSAQ